MGSINVLHTQNIINSQIGDLNYLLKRFNCHGASCTPLLCDKTKRTHFWPTLCLYSRISRSLINLYKVARHFDKMTLGPEPQLLHTCISVRRGYQNNYHSVITTLLHNCCVICSRSDISVIPSCSRVFRFRATGQLLRLVVNVYSRYQNCLLINCKWP